MTLIERWNGTVWTVQPSLNPGEYGNSLSAVAALSPSNVWAVGVADGNQTQTLIEYWNGTAWSVQPSPNPAPVSQLKGVAGTSATNVWAVGDRNLGDSHPDRYHTLIEYWNGTAWSVQPSPNPAPGHDYLTAWPLPRLRMPGWSALPALARAGAGP